MATKKKAKKKKAKKAKGKPKKKAATRKGGKSRMAVPEGGDAGTKGTGSAG